MALNISVVATVCSLAMGLKPLPPRLRHLVLQVWSCSSFFAGVNDRESLLLDMVIHYPWTAERNKNPIEITIWIYNHRNNHL